MMNIKTLLIILFLSCSTSLKADTVLVYGDSLSAAYGMPQEQGWAALLDKDVQPKHTILNASISGETTSGGLGRLPATLTELKPDVVFIALGGNDALLGQSIKRTRANLEKMIAIVRESGAKPALGGIAPPPSYGPRFVATFRKMFKEVATSAGVPFFDLYIERIANDPSLMQKDGIHPNTAAQSQIKALIEPFILALVGH